VPVALPPVSEGDDFRALYARMTAQARVANARLSNGRACVARQRESYGRKP